MYVKLSKLSHKVCYERMSSVMTKVNQYQWACIIIITKKLFNIVKM